MSTPETLIPPESTRARHAALTHPAAVAGVAGVLVLVGFGVGPHTGAAAAVVGAAATGGYLLRYAARQCQRRNVDLSLAGRRGRRRAPRQRH